MKLDNIIEHFESKFLEALDFKYKSYYPEAREHLIAVSPIQRMDIKKFLAIYRNQDNYPQERLENLIYLLIDIKIEMFYIIELDLGLYNHLVYNIGYDNGNIDDVPQ